MANRKPSLSKLGSPTIHFLFFWSSLWNMFDTSTRNDPNFHRRLALGVIYLSPIVASIMLFLKPSTYGKLHQSKRNWFGPLVPAKWCWIIFESPNWIWVLVCYSHSPKTTLGATNTILLAWFFWHYIHRSLLYPLHMSSDSKFPIGILAMTIPYTIING
jgi:steroid 5-alpha-reductase